MGMLPRERLKSVFGGALVVTVVWMGFAVSQQPGPPVQPASRPQLADTPDPALRSESPPRPKLVMPVDISGRPDASIPPLMIPVAGVKPGQLSDTFTQARVQGARSHDAIDIMASLGTPVIAAAAGTIEKLFLSRDGGNTIYIRSPDRGVIYYYAHLDGYEPGLAERQTIVAGQQIGRVGFSGNANPAAPHLHFAIWLTRPEAIWSDSALAINPYPLLTRH